LDLVFLEIGDIFAQAEARSLEVAALVKGDFRSAEDADRGNAVVEAGRHLSHPLTRADAKFLAPEIDVPVEAGTVAVLVIAIPIPIAVVAILVPIPLALVAVLGEQVSGAANQNHDKQEKSD
jgi:hypothetical protein